MRAVIALIVALALHSCIAQQAAPAGLDIFGNVVAWAASSREVNISSNLVSAWGASHGNYLIPTFGTSPALVANKFNDVVPAPSVTFAGSQCLGSANPTVPTTDYSIFVVANAPGTGTHTLVAQQDASEGGYALTIVRDGSNFVLRLTVDGTTVATASDVTGNVPSGTPYVFWAVVSSSATLVRFEDLSGTASSSTPSWTTSTFTVGCDQSTNNNNLNGEIGEVIVLDIAVSSAQRNIILNNLAARYDALIGSNQHYTGMSPSSSDYDLDVSGVGSEADGSVTEGNSAQLTITTPTPLSTGDYILFGRADDGDFLDVLPYRANYTRFTRDFYLTVFVGGSVTDVTATVSLEFDVSSILADLAAGDNLVYFLVQRNTTSDAWEIVSEAGVLTTSTLTFSDIAVWTGYYTVASSALPPAAPLPPSSAPSSGPAAGPAAPTARAPTAAYPSPGITVRSDAVATAIQVVNVVILAACLLF